VSRTGEHGQIPALTGVRALAAWLVFFHHHPTRVLEPNGLLLWWELHVGVTLFFVLSGFVITWRYDRRGPRRESFVRGYFVNRFARIYPLYFVLIVAVMLAYRVRSPTAWLWNLTIFTKFEAGIPQAWSLRVEECFYLCAPFIFFLWRRRPWLPLVAASAALAALWPLARVQALSGIVGPPTNLLLYTFVGRFFEFYVGIWLAKRVSAAAGADAPTPRSRRFPTWTVAGLAGIAGVIVALAAIKAGPGKAYSYGLYHPLGVALNNLLLPIFIAALYWGLIEERSWIRSVLSTRPAGLLGRSSYAFYLIHIAPVLTILAVGLYTFIGWFSVPAAAGLARIVDENILVRFALVNLAAIALYKLIEQPANRFLRRRFGGTVASPILEPSAEPRASAAARG
jgi:peptidoglycan/LPS O-acetylase OafA/YrhL